MTTIKQLTNQVRSLNARLMNALHSVSRQVITHNAPHKWFKEGSGNNDPNKGGIDFHMESYAGDDDRFPNPDTNAITTKEKQKALYARHVSGSSEPFYGVDLDSGKIYQFNPKTGKVEVSDYDGDTKGYGQRLPDGWQNFLREQGT
jgi:hypothetical protein